MRTNLRKKSMPEVVKAPRRTITEHVAYVSKRRTGDSFKDRWKDVVIWESFWNELQAILIARTYDSFEAGYRRGAKDSKEAAHENYMAGLKEGARRVRQALKERKC